jgi:hypothetical protein
MKRSENPGQRAKAFNQARQAHLAASIFAPAPRVA